MYVRPISTRLLRGMLTPAIRAMPQLPLALLVSRVLADDEDPPVAADDLALLAHRLDRRSYLHGPFRLMIQTGWLWRPGRPPLPIPRTLSRRTGTSRPRARRCRIAKGLGASAHGRRPMIPPSRVLARDRLRALLRGAAELLCVLAAGLLGGLGRLLRDVLAALHRLLAGLL